MVRIPTINIVNRYIHYYADVTRGIWGYVMLRRGKQIAGTKAVGHFESVTEEPEVKRPRRRMRLRRLLPRTAYRRKRAPAGLRPAARLRWHPVDEDTAYAVLWHHFQRLKRKNPDPKWEALGICEVHIAARYARKYNVALDSALDTIADNLDNIRYLADEVGIELPVVPKPAYARAKPVEPAVERPLAGVLAKIVQWIKKQYRRLQALFHRH